MRDAMDLELLLMQYSAEKSRHEEESRKIAALDAGRSALCEALFRDVGLWLLLMDPTVNTDALMDKTAADEMLRTKFQGRPWTDGYRSAQSFESARFRALVTTLATQIEMWIAAEREACAKVAEADHGGTAPAAWLSGYRSGREAAARDIRFRNQR